MFVRPGYPSGTSRNRNRHNIRGPVNLQRYGMRQTNVKLEEFARGGAWPPEDDSWFWGTATPLATVSGEQDAQGGVSTGGTDADMPRDAGEA